MTMWLSFAKDRVIRLRAPLKTDSHGNETLDWSGELDQLVIDLCSVTPLGGSEDDQHREATSGSFQVLAPGTVDVTAVDRLLLPRREGQWRVKGDPGQWDQLPRIACTQIVCERWVG